MAPDIFRVRATAVRLDTVGDTRGSMDGYLGRHEKPPEKIRRDRERGGVMVVKTKERCSNGAKTDQR